MNYGEIRINPAAIIADATLAVGFRDTALVKSYQPVDKRGDEELIVLSLLGWYEAAVLPYSFVAVAFLINQLLRPRIF